MYFGFQFILSFKTQSSKRMRVIAGFIYVLHPLVIILIRGFSKATGLFHILVENSLIHYLLVSLCSFIIAAALSYLLQRGRREEFHYGRAWIELNRNALCHNVNELRTKLPPECELMPAVKADAYGHGAVLIAKELNAMGIKAFCVATVLEGIKLRKNKIKGDILILGYTHPKQFPLLRKYKLIQTVIDYSYANSMNQYGKKFRVHLCIDTGMHRLGERSENINELFDIFKMKNLKIEGIYTHLCSSDSSETEDQIFTNNQGKVFFEVIEKLKLRGIICSKTHILASYGILNYPHLGGNYARVGIALYGILSSKEDVNKSDVFLEPVLAVKARIIEVKQLYKGESAGYGRQYIAKRDMKLAVISIGYADGLPRALSKGGGRVLVDGFEANVIGRICMDQTLIDVTELDAVRCGDIAVVIGKSKEKEITACDMASQTNTISNEIVSRLGERLERVMVS
ncbi:serine racemase VanT catalytic subunit [Lachnotalea glycerini]|uniref:serine racemase VanT catalytic subunit n=1 Tax=Lachnotalea glycerini TaxID=1763509 RepID=UPI00191C704D